MIWGSTKMTTITIEELQKRFDDIAERAEHGESFLVVDGAKPVMKIEPIEQLSNPSSGSQQDVPTLRK
jgi:antitoxin (DNA-binding transcriptional repressor) of toxin-antitoxin stability system